jgi:UDPglucose 6-dehydrogenase
MNITISGAGYVVLANAVLLARHNNVTAYDISEEKVNMINRRVCPFDDREINEYFADTNLKLKATGKKTEAYSGRKIDYIIIATPTDYKMKKNSFDTSSVESAISDISKFSPSSAVVIKSTVPIGFTERMRAEYPELHIFFSPEFLREGKALYDNLYPTRIIIGDTSAKAREFADLMTRGTIKKDVQVLFMPSTEAEAVKLFSNTYLAMRITFFNELDTYSELKTLDTKSIIEGVCLDPRIGNFYNNPSFGFGGYCLPKDTHQIRKNYAGIPHSIISAIVKSNKIRKKHIAKMIDRHNPKTAGIYKLAMKSGSDNYRSSAVLDIIKKLQKKHITVIIFDPAINKKNLFKCRIINDFGEFTQMSDVIIANRVTEELNGVKDRIYTRDVFLRD